MQEIRQQAQTGNLDPIIDRSIQTGQPAIPTETDMAEENIGAKLTALSGDPAFQKEYKLRLLHRMMIRQLPMDLIAKALNCSVRMVYKLRDDLFAQLREEASNKDLPTYVGMTDGFYNDIIGIAMRMASGKASDIRKLGAMQVALQAQRDRTHFYETIGFHDVMKISPASGAYDRATDQADKLIEMAENILGHFTDVEVPEAGAEISPRDVFTRKQEEEPEIKVRVL